MKSEAGVWIDHAKAVIAIISGKAQQLRQVTSSPEKRRLGTHYDEVIACIGDAHSILILGPGEATIALKERLQKAGLGDRIVGIETTPGEMTDREVAAQVRKRLLKNRRSDRRVKASVRERFRKGALIPSALLLVLAGAARGTEGAPAATPERQVLAAGPQYGAGPLWGVFFGRDYRDLWIQPIDVPVLDLAGFAGGLTPTGTGGRRQTRTLRFKGANGREYKFRSIDKDPAKALPPELRGEGLEYLARDQTSSGFPGADLVAEPLLKSAGVLNAHWRMVVLPDAPSLGAFRGEFAGTLGVIEDAPEKSEPGGTPGFEKIARIVDSEELYGLLRKDPAERVDARAYLRARLVDLYLGDWDRHQEQWSWGKSETDGLWKPIPKDRDMVFSRYDGQFVRMAPSGDVTLGNFSERYQPLTGFTWSGREMDRRFLAGLGAEVWEGEAQDLTRRLTDDVIDAAARRMPPEYYSLRGAWLARALKARRDGLAGVARDWYRMLAREVDVFATDDAERLHVSQTADGVQVILLTKDNGARATFERLFKKGETEEVRVYLNGGDDAAVVQGRGPIKVRVIGGAGADVLDDSAGGYTRFYDAEGENAVVYGPGTRFSARAHDEPESPKEDRPRDSGSKSSRPLWLSAGSDVGMFVGAGFTRTTFGFRRSPFASRQMVRVGYAAGPQKFRGEYLGELRRPESRTSFELYARASGIEIQRFYGFGNETTNAEGDDFYLAENSQYTLLPSVSLAVGPRARFRIGPKLRYTEIRRPEGRFIGAARPYGFGGFGEAGAATSLEWDSRDDPGAPRKGFMAAAGGSVFPPLWQVEQTFGEVHGEAAGVVTVDALLETTLAARVGGKRAFGQYPYQEAAFLGGSHRAPQVRGLRGQRYAGDAAVYGNAELRVRLFRVAILLPTEVGVFGLVDAGRVFLDGESSKRWHDGVGGGLWIAPARRANTVTFSAVQSEGRTSLYLGAGFLF